MGYRVGTAPVNGYAEVHHGIDAGVKFVVVGDKMPGAGRIEIAEDAGIGLYAVESRRFNGIRGVFGIGNARGGRSGVSRYYIARPGFAIWPSA